MARKPLTTAQRNARDARRKNYAKRISVATVALVCAYMSYGHIVHVAQMFGQHGVAPYLMPFSVDGLMVACTLSLSDRNWRPYAGLIAGIIATVSANAVAGGNTVGGIIVSTWPAVALLVTVEVILHGKARPKRTARRAKVAAPSKGAPRTLKAV